MGSVIAERGFFFFFSPQHHYIFAMMWQNAQAEKCSSEAKENLQIKILKISASIPSLMTCFFFSFASSLFSWKKNKNMRLYLQNNIKVRFFTAAM